MVLQLLNRRLTVAGLALVSLLMGVGLTAQLVEPAAPAPESQQAEPPPPPQRHLGYLDALVLGVVEGVTEYLPVSSTGHLLIANNLLELDSEAPMLGDDGAPLLTPDGTPVTLKAAADAYAIIIQAGAIAAVLLIYWRRVLSVIMGFLGRDRHGLLLGRNLIAAFLPAAVLGLLFDDWIEAHLFGVGPVLVALFAGAILMLWVERWRRRSTHADHVGRELHSLTVFESILIGLMQSVAMWPGTSRSMMTIVGGYVVGLSPRRAAEFSFLLGLITLTAASGYTLLKSHESLAVALDMGPALLGIFVATITAALSVKWLVNYLSKHGLALFAWYRIALAIVLALVVWR